MKSTISIPIPNSVKLNCSVNQKIKKGQLLYQYDCSTKLFEVEVAKILKINSKQIDRFVKVKIGRKIQKGDLIAVKSSIFEKIIIRSPYAGEVSEYDFISGTVKIAQELKGKDLRSDFNGKVVDIKKNNLIIELDCFSLPLIMYDNDIVTGLLCYLDSNNSNLADITAEVGDKIILIRSLTYELYKKLKALKVKAVIVEKKPQVKLDIPLALCDKEVFEKIIKLNNKLVLLSQKSLSFLE